jgi:hypothetical protein
MGFYNVPFIDAPFHFHYSRVSIVFELEYDLLVHLFMISLVDSLKLIGFLVLMF